MEMRQMMERLLVKMDANQEQTNAEMKGMQQKMDATQEKMDANQAKTDASQERMNVSLREMKEEIKSGQAEMKSTVSAIQEKMDASIADMKDGRKERTALQEMTEAGLDSKEPNPEEMQSEAEHREVPKEHTAVKFVGGLRKRRRGRHLAAGRRGQPKERTRGNCGSRKKLAVAGKKITHRAGVARRKGRGHEGPSVEQGRRKSQIRDKVARGTRKGRTLGKRQMTLQEGITGARNRDFREQLRLGSERTSSGIYRKTFVLEIAKRIAGFSVRV
jgi:hypothetical protein